MFRRILVLLFLAVGGSACGPKKEEPPLSIVIFGATGDLTAKKILPALSNLARDQALPEKFSVIGIGRKDYSHEDFRKHANNPPFLERLYYAQVDLESGQGYERLDELLSLVENGAPSNRIYFLSTPSKFFAPIVEN